MMTKLRERLRRYKLRLSLIGFMVVLVAVYFSPSILVTIYPGHGGVLFKRLGGGTVMNTVYGEGLHLVSPWNTMYRYDARVRELKETVEVLSRNGLTVKVLVSVRYHLVFHKLPVLHQRVGPEFIDKIIIPVTISSVREVVGKYKPEELYTTARHVIQDEILIEAIEETGRVPLVWDDIIIQNIQLPQLINVAIEEKLRLQQEYLSYEFRIKREEMEAERKRVEAEGIRTFQQIVANSLSKGLLTWQGIKATSDLAASPNSKLVVIGGGDNGLPLILNTGDWGPTSSGLGEGGPSNATSSLAPKVVQSGEPVSTQSGGSLTGVKELWKKLNAMEMGQQAPLPEKGAEQPAPSPETPPQQAPQAAEPAKPAPQAQADGAQAKPTQAKPAPQAKPAAQAKPGN